MTDLDGPRFAVFLRAINVGGRSVRTAEVVERLRPLEVASVGAAGSFAVAGARDAATVEVAIRAVMPFETEMLVVDAPELDRLLAAGPLGARTPPPDARWAVTMLLGPAGRRPALPIVRPLDRAWQVTLQEVRGPFALSLYRRRADPSERLVYPNEVVEREFGVRATTRWWETVEEIRDRLRSLGSEPTASRAPRASAKARPTRDRPSRLSERVPTARHKARGKKHGR